MNTPSKQQRNKRHLMIMLFIAVGMFGFGYALVPLYNTMCATLGINGKIGGVATYDPKTAIDKSRLLTVQFLTMEQAQLNGAFYPVMKKIQLHPGEQKRVSFYVKNPAEHTVTLQAIPSVSPGIAAKYLKKTECFCFTQQTLRAKEERDMPVVFHFDPDLPKDINVITISYTMYDVTPKG